MNYAPQVIQIDLIVSGVCALAWLALLLLWRQQRQRGAFARVEARLQASLSHERGNRALAEQALTDTRRQVCHLSKSQQSLRDAERRRIARDLHDDLGQQLLAMSFELGALAAQHPELKEALHKVDERIAATLRSMRSIVRDLQPEGLRDGLRGAVEQQVAQFSRLSGIACQLDAEAIAADAAIDGGMDQVIYRILQESLSNIARHAKASQVSVGISRAEDGLSLTVRDNGIGIGGLGLDGGHAAGSARAPARVAAPPTPRAAPPAAGRRGHGLRGMAERVAEAGGRFDVASAPGMGTALTMSFPLP
ncbi:Signal transduction histidine kinase [Duganella sp. CF517]|uniref:sensor histidine kinase n=1 Tax=Duganella sp. CF517 TaxID=1881038 RepID=UPI0008C3F3F2|nr:histidine kinase [Duganella sp. CF517]SEN80064.1 Signal transduction histidine kinase [Duganella sp. CF517]